MKFISWNVNGFRSCLGKGFADFFAQADADFVCLQETKMQPGQAEFAPAGYFQYWNSALKKGYSGTAIFAKKEPLSVAYGLGIPEHDTEGRAITLEYEAFYLVCVYTPNAQKELARLDYRMSWEDALREYLCALDQKKPVVYCGDLNVAHCEIDLKNPKTNRFSAGFPTRSVRNLPVCWIAALQTPSVSCIPRRCSIPGGAICITPEKRTWAGVLTTLWCPTAFCPR